MPATRLYEDERTIAFMAWQAVFHFHVHVIPRHAGDPLRLPWHRAPGNRDDLAAAACELTA